jgi:hypothetical protein
MRKIVILLELAAARQGLCAPLILVPSSIVAVFVEIIGTGKWLGLWWL